MAANILGHWKSRAWVLLIFYFCNSLLKAFIPGQNWGLLTSLFMTFSNVMPTSEYNSKHCHSGFQGSGSN